jgi:hypothetical protein
MKPKIKYWDHNLCKNEALKYTSRKDFNNNSKGAYLYALRKKILDEVCSHMVSNITYWNFESCKIEALKFCSKSEFNRANGSAYQFAIRNAILDQVCSHMKPKGSRYKRMIYAYEFSDNNVYVGLTYNELKRKSEHLTDGRGPVANHRLLSGLTPTYKKLHDYVDVDYAKLLEQEFIDSYKSKGWVILNSSKAGALGGNLLKWTKEECLKIALKYEKKVDFKESKLHYTVYNSAYKQGFLDEICAHMKANKHWNFDTCLVEAKRFRNRTDFQKHSIGAYTFARLNGFLDNICEHMNVKLKNWSKSECSIEARKYNTRSDFQRNGKGAYLFASRRGWLDDICFHMIIKKVYWTPESCKLEALKYKNAKDFRTQSGGAFNYAKKKKILEEIKQYFEKQT